MDGSPERSTSVTAAAVVAILSSLFVMLCCSVAFFAILSLKVTGTSPELPPFVRTAALAGQGFVMGLSVFGVATGIGLIYLRNWARISILISGGLCVFFGAVGIPIGYFAVSTPIPNAPTLPAEGMGVVRWILLFIYGVPMLIGVWWLILFTRKSVRAQFGGAAGSTDSGVPQKPRCPLPVAALAWLYIGSILNLLFLPFLSFRVPILVFGWVPPRSVGSTVLLLSCVAFTIAGIGLLKLKTWSYSLTIGLQLFWLASSIVTMLSPNYSAVMESFLKEMQASLHLPESQFPPTNFTHHYGWAIGIGLLLAGAILGLLVYYRPRFLEEASKAASAS